MNIAEAYKSETEDRHHAITALADPLLLKHGDRLTRDEFECRYEAMPHIRKAELIEGVVYMGSPVSTDHGSCHGEIITWLGMYSFATPGVRIYDNTTLCLDTNNEFQPDALLRIETHGSSRITQNGYLEGAPELVAEIAVSSASQDIRSKKKVYERLGIREYIVWRVRKKRVDWFELKSGKYEPLTPDSDGVIRSRVFPGLNLSVDALINENLAKVAEELQNGLKTKEYANFIRNLKR
ncbi:MAG: Uma2 family endonuclease [Desulfobacterales bacterium]|nr:Uma2 family endonuclease [Desulfobacterales bacterium]